MITDREDLGFFCWGGFGVGSMFGSFCLVYVCAQEYFCPTVNFGTGVGEEQAAANEPEEAETQLPRACCADSAPGP